MLLGLLTIAQIVGSQFVAQAGIRYDACAQRFFGIMVGFVYDAFRFKPLSGTKIVGP